MCFSDFVRLGFIQGAYIFNATVRVRRNHVMKHNHYEKKKKKKQSTTHIVLT